MSDPAASAVLVTGVNGAGKRTVRLDVDFLAWFDVGQDRTVQRQVVLGNLRHVATSFLDHGARRLVLATLPGDRPVRETSRAICAWLGWV